jgi:hypothetical protein
MKLSERMVLIALAEVGVSEKPRGSNRGSMVDQYQSATDLNALQWGAWCAAFVCWVMLQAMAAEQGKRYTFRRMTTAAVRFIKTWSLRQDDSTRTRDEPGLDIQPGDVVIYRFSHTGIAVTAPDNNGCVQVVEGNTNKEGGREGYEVCKQTRKCSAIKTRIRITV